MKQFFDLLMRPDCYMEFRAIHLKRGVTGRAFVQTLEDAEKFIIQHGRDAEIYMGVAPRTRRGGKLADCALPTALWIDADDEKIAREELKTFKLKPSMIVHSGRGLHIYWLVEDELDDGLDKMHDALRLLAIRLKGDMKSAEPAHILRFPGTMNHKYGHPRPVQIEHIDAALRYRVDDIIAASIVTSPAAYARAEAFVKEYPPAVQGEHGDNATYELACVLARDHGLTTHESLMLMLEWNRHCVPPWSETELMKKIHNAEVYGRNDRGEKDPARDFEGFDLENIAGEPGPSVSLMDKLSERFKPVDDDGVLRIYEKRYSEIFRCLVWTKYRKRDFYEIYRPISQFPLVQFGKKSLPTVEYWMEHWRNKKTFVGAALYPESPDETTPGGMLNMWDGFSVDPAPGDWSLLRSLLYKLCDGYWNPESYEYCINWLARAVQYPWEPARTVLVFKGDKGTGKSTFGHIIRGLFKVHGMYITTPELLVGRFNKHLENGVMLFADEAFYAGSRGDESKLKALITENRLMYEEKGKMPSMGRNCLHIIMASNRDWVIPASQDERRFAVFDVDNAKFMMDDWVALNQQMKNGGLAAFLHDLMRRDVSQFDPAVVPQTVALAEQHIQSMGPFESWLYDAAQNNWRDFGDDEARKFPIDDVYGSYLRACDERKITAQRKSRDAFGIALRKYLPKDSLIRTKNSENAWIYIFPDAESCVKHIERHKK